MAALTIHPKRYELGATPLEQVRANAGYWRRQKGEWRMAWRAANGEWGTLQAA